MRSKWGWGALSPSEGQAGSGERLPCCCDCGQCKPLHWKSLPGVPGAFLVVDVTKQVSRPSSCRFVAARTETSNREMVFIVMYTPLCAHAGVSARILLFLFSANDISATPLCSLFLVGINSYLKKTPIEGSLPASGATTTRTVWLEYVRCRRKCPCTRQPRVVSASKRPDKTHSISRAPWPSWAPSLPRWLSTVSLFKSSQRTYLPPLRLPNY